MDIKLVIFTYLIFKLSQLLLALGTQLPTVNIIAFAVGFGIPVILTYFAFKDIPFFKWLMAFTIVVGGISSLFAGIILIKNDQILLRIIALLLGSYLSLGGYCIVIKTKNKEKWV